MEVVGVVCPRCETFIYSRHRHDMRYCPCDYCYVDGGQGVDGYLRFGWGSDVDMSVAEKYGMPMRINREV
jgi:hypothetical protein